MGHWTRITRRATGADHSWSTPSRSAWRKNSRSSIPRRGSSARTCSRAPRLQLAGARRADQARAAPVDRRGRHEDLRERAELREEIFRIRRELTDGAERVGLRVAAAGTHPFSHWKDQILSPGVRYDSIVEELQQLARSLLIFGLHVHVAVPDRSDDDRPDEPGAVLPAAPARAVDELAVLDGARHRA